MIFRRAFLLKLVFRRLPPNCSPKQLVETFQELPPHDWLYFVPSDPTYSLFSH